MKYKGGCNRNITNGLTKTCPEQIPIHLRIHSVYRRNSWSRKGCCNDDKL